MLWRGGSILCCAPDKMNCPMEAGLRFMCWRMDFIARCCTNGNRKRGGRGGISASPRAWASCSQAAKPM